MTPTIEATQNSIKLSYLRFVSDAAPGLLLLLVLLIHQRHLPVWLEDAPPTFTAMVGVLAFLLTTPLGLLINGLSHFTLGGIQHAICARCFSSNVWPIASTRKILLTAKCANFFNIDKKDWPQIVYEVDDLFDTYMPHLAAGLDHVRALKKFSRSVAFLALVSVLVFAGECGAITAVIVSSTVVVAIAFGQYVRSGFCVALLITATAPLICCAQQLRPMAVLFGVAVVAIMLAGLVEFYQYTYVMLLLYQLFDSGDGGHVKLNAQVVREQLLEVVGRLREPNTKPPRARLIQPGYR